MSKTPPAVPRRQESSTPQLAAGTTPTPQAQGSRINQAHEHNPHPAPQMQTGRGFRIRIAIAEAEASGVDISQTDNSCHFFLPYHLKFVCNTHCGGHHLNRPLSQIEFGRLGEWLNRYCGGDEAPLVQEVDTGNQRQASNLYSQTGRPQGSQGRISKGGGGGL